MKSILCEKGIGFQGNLFQGRNGSMFCRHCGARISSGAKFCDACGFALTKEGTYTKKQSKWVSVMMPLGIGLAVIIALIIVFLPRVTSIMAPKLIKQRSSNNEGSATASIRTLASASMLFKSSFGRFPSSLTELKRENLIDNVLGSGEKSGYKYSVSPGNLPNLQFSATAIPISSHTGSRCFFIDETQVIRYSDTGLARPNSTPLGQ
jgi:competence protein ComGC